MGRLSPQAAGAPGSWSPPNGTTPAQSITEVINPILARLYFPSSDPRPHRPAKSALWTQTEEPPASYIIQSPFRFLKNGTFYRAFSAPTVHAYGAETATELDVASTKIAILRAERDRLANSWRFFVGPFLTPALLFLPWVIRQRRIRPWLLASIPFILAKAAYHACYPLTARRRRS